MKKKNVISLILAMFLSTGTLTGCVERATQADGTNDAESLVEEDVVAEAAITFGEVDQYGEKPASREYQAYEHVFMLRYDLLDDLGVNSSRNITGASFPNFEGYEIVSIQNFSGVGSKIGTTQTYGFDVWYTNVVPVVVEPLYHDYYRYYDYSQPGQVVEQEVFYDQDSTLQK